MKKKNKIKKRAINRFEKFSFDTHCGGGCELLQGVVCPECVEWGGFDASTFEGLRDIQIIG
jgi:hypothetical protein